MDPPQDTGGMRPEHVMRQKLEQDYQQRLAYLNDELMELVREVLKDGTCLPLIILCEKTDLKKM